MVVHKHNEWNICHNYLYHATYFLIATLLCYLYTIGYDLYTLFMYTSGNTLMENLTKGTYPVGKSE